MFVHHCISGSLALCISIRGCHRMIHHCFSGWLSLCVCAVCAGYVRAIFIKESIRCQNDLAIVFEHLPYGKGILSISNHSTWFGFCIDCLSFALICRTVFLGYKVSLRARRSEIRDIEFVSVPSLIGCDTIQDRTWTEVLYGDYGAENLRPPLHV